jgi:hypothetical protein
MFLCTAEEITGKIMMPNNLQINRLRFYTKGL